MTFTFHCHELVQILTGLGPAMARKSTLPVLKHIYIIGRRMYVYCSAG
jgi:hypothetical protein